MRCLCGLGAVQEYSQARHENGPGCCGDPIQVFLPIHGVPDLRALGQARMHPFHHENEGILVATSFFDTLPTEQAASFVKNFKAFSKETDYVGEYGEYGYRGMMLWAAAVKKANSASPDDVIKALDGVSFTGAGGLYTIDGKTNHTVMDVHIVEGNREGSFNLIKSFS